MSERHLFVLWERAHQKDRIVDNIKKNFDVVTVREVEWKHFSATLSRFYQQDTTELPKESHTGSGPFVAVEVNDPHPLYGFRKTSRGPRLVNISMFAARKIYRQWSGDPDTVHASDSPQEAQANIAMLDEPGTEGWDSIEEMLRVLDATTRYVVLRNFKKLPEEAGDDLDLLVEDRNAAFWALNARLAFPEDYRVHVYTDVKGKTLPIDLRFVGDCYMDPVWERDILARREFTLGGFWKPSDEDWFWALVYHAYIHKGEMKEEYGKATSYATRQDLRNFLEETGYRITMPQDRTVPALQL